MPTRQLATAGILLLSLVPGALVAQARETESLDPTAWGVVYDIPATRAVRLQADVPYLRDSARSLTLDIYTPPGMRAGARLPAVVFLNAVGDGPDSTERVKRWGIYSSWPRLVAAHGMVGIYAASANVGGANQLLFSDSVPPGIKAAVLYYGSPPDTSRVLRRDLPVL